MKFFVPLIVLICAIFLYQSCSQEQNFYVKEAAPARAPAVEPSPPDILVAEPDKCATSICNPLGAEDLPPSQVETPSVPENRLGLLGSLYEGQEFWGTISMYLNSGYKHPEQLLFSNFNTPIRSFSEGFGLNDKTLKNRAGETLVEWFAITAKGNITLPKDVPAGFYHIVSLSDDGITVSVNNREILSHPEIHAPAIDCAFGLFELKKGQELPFSLAYFQGPRYHISLVTFIKKIDDVANFKLENFCGTSANGYEAITEAGYKIISPSWFTLPK